jgi:hypothetical protein
MTGQNKTKKIRKMRERVRENRDKTKKGRKNAYQSFTSELSSKTLGFWSVYEHHTTSRVPTPAQQQGLGQPTRQGRVSR